MTNPAVGHWSMLKRLARYFKGRPSRVWERRWQGTRKGVSTDSDSDVGRMQADANASWQDGTSCRRVQALQRWEAGGMEGLPFLKSNGRGAIQVQVR